MNERDDLMWLVPIGRVHSEIRDRRLMPVHGAPATVEIYPEFQDGLLLAEENSHLWVIAWFEGIERDRLQIVRPEYEPRRRRRGVFGLQSTTRPNPIGIRAGKLLSVRDNVLQFDRLGFLDGTPVLDIKRYSPSFDSIFSARSSQDRHQSIEELTALEELEAAAILFHGTLTNGVAAGARLVQHAVREWNIRPKDEGLRIGIPTESDRGDVIDAIQGITGASFGNRRLHIVPGSAIQLHYGQQHLSATLHDLDGLSLEAVHDSPMSRLFRLSWQ